MMGSRRDDVSNIVNVMMRLTVDMIVHLLTMIVFRNSEAGSRYMEIHSRARSESSARLPDRYCSVQSISDHVSANEKDF